MNEENYNYLNMFNNFSIYDNKKDMIQYDSNSANIFSPINPNISINILNFTNNSPQTNFIFENNKNVFKNSKINLLNNEYNNNNTGANISTKKTLVLDLDETLVHSSMVPFQNKINIVLRVNLRGIEYIIYVIKRPYVDEFLAEMSLYYEIVIFTASLSQYAEQLISIIDKNKVVKYILNRDSCTFSRGFYFKNLSIINKDLKDVIIVDNNPVSYAFNNENGIPILTWIDNPNDTELVKMIPLLKYLSKVNDVRNVINQIVNKTNGQLDINKVNNILNNENTRNAQENNMGIKYINNDLYKKQKQKTEIDLNKKENYYIVNNVNEIQIVNVNNDILNNNTIGQFNNENLKNNITINNNNNLGNNSLHTNIIYNPDKNFIETNNYRTIPDNNIKNNTNNYQLNNVINNNYNKEIKNVEKDVTKGKYHYQIPNNNSQNIILNNNNKENIIEYSNVEINDIKNSENDNIVYITDNDRINTQNSINAIQNKNLIINEPNDINTTKNNQNNTNNNNVEATENNNNNKRINIYNYNVQPNNNISVYKIEKNIQNDKNNDKIQDIEKNNSYVNNSSSTYINHNSEENNNNIFFLENKTRNKEKNIIFENNKINIIKKYHYKNKSPNIHKSNAFINEANYLNNEKMNNNSKNMNIDYISKSNISKNNKSSNGIKVKEIIKIIHKNNKELNTNEKKPYNNKSLNYLKSQLNANNNKNILEKTKDENKINENNENNNNFKYSTYNANIKINDKSNRIISEEKSSNELNKPNIFKSKNYKIKNINSNRNQMTINEDKIIKKTNTKKIIQRNKLNNNNEINSQKLSKKNIFNNNIDYNFKIPENINNNTNIFFNELEKNLILNYDDVKIPEPLDIDVNKKTKIYQRDTKTYITTYPNNFENINKNYDINNNNNNLIKYDKE